MADEIAETARARRASPYHQHELCNARGGEKCFVSRHVIMAQQRAMELVAISYRQELAVISYRQVVMARSCRLAGRVTWCYNGRASTMQRTMAIRIAVIIIIRSPSSRGAGCSIARPLLTKRLSSMASSCSRRNSSSSVLSLKLPHFTSIQHSATPVDCTPSATDCARTARRRPARAIHHPPRPCPNSCPRS